LSLFPGQPRFRDLKGTLVNTGQEGFSGGTTQPEETRHIGNPGNLGALGNFDATVFAGQPGQIGSPGMWITLPIVLYLITYSLSHGCFYVGPYIQPEN